MTLALNKYSTLLRLLEYAEVDGNWTNVETYINGLIAGTAGYEAGNALKLGGVAANLYSLKTGNGGGPFSSGAMTTQGVATINGAGTDGNVAPVLIIAGEAYTAYRHIWSSSISSATSDNHLTLAICTGAGTTTPVLDITPAGVAVTGKISAAGAFGFLADNTYPLGSAAYRASTIYAGTGTINTSDAREKTAVTPLTESEIAAAKDLAKDIGIYQFLCVVASKGDSARHHIGMTVQRAIEIMASRGLDPFEYGFICHDAWDDMFVDHAAIEAVPAQPAQPGEYAIQTVDEPVIIDGVATILQRSVLVCTKEPVPAIEEVRAVPAWREQTQTAGDRFAFRTDELLLFIARGFEARLTALEVVA